MTALRVPLGVALCAALLYLPRLGAIPLVDASEGFHVAIAQEMADRGDWVTPHFDGLRYFDKPPLLYWLMAAGFRLAGTTEWAARLWTALAVVASAALTAWLGVRLGSERLGMLAGLLFAANVEVFIFGRFAKPDLLFVLCVLLAFAGFVVAYQSGSRRALLAGYAGLGAAVMAKDILGALGPLAVIALFLYLAREPVQARRWLPWTGLAVLALMVVPWHLAMELRNPGFLRYMLIDTHVLGVVEQRAFPDEDVPLTTIEFLGATALGFFPWSLAVPVALLRALRPRSSAPEARGWLLVGLWAGGFLALLALSPFKLPHYGLSAFPAFALLVAKAWDDALARRAGGPGARSLLWPPLVVLATFALVAGAGWRGVALIPPGTLSAVDLYSRNLRAQGRGAPFIAPEALQAWLPVVALIFGLGCLALAVALRRDAPAVGLAALLAVIVAFLPVTAQGLTLLARARSAEPVIEALTRRLGPDDVVVHEGALENTGSLVIALRRPVRIVNGGRSNLAFGATFPEGRETVWDVARLRATWRDATRVFLVSVVGPDASVARELDGAPVCLLRAAGGRRLYSNRCD